MSDTQPHLVMFDVDGTLVESCDFDAELYREAVYEVLGVLPAADWTHYRHVTDAGILSQLLEEHCEQAARGEAFAEVKRRFVSLVERHTARSAVLPVAGAPELLAWLSEREDVALAFATGGWSESARSKLAAAGIDFPDIPLASSCDHHSRVEILKIAERRARGERYATTTYLGDGVWDRQASEALGYAFVPVGRRLKGPDTLIDYVDVAAAAGRIGL